MEKEKEQQTKLTIGEKTFTVLGGPTILVDNSTGQKIFLQTDDIFVVPMSLVLA